MYGSLEALRRDLESDDIRVRLSAVSKFNTVQPESRTSLFQRVLSDFNHEVREEAAKAILLCPNLYMNFLADPDAQVRIAIINLSVEIGKALNRQVEIVSDLEKLVNDSVAEVRCALARILHLHVKGEDPDEMKMRIVNLVERLLRDRNDDVRVAASSNVKELTIQNGFDWIFERGYECLHHMLTDTQWRVRNNAVELLFGLALVCTPEYFNANLFPFLMQFLRDPCNKVRQFALSALPTLASRFSSEGDWLKTKLIGHLQELAQSPNFTYRETYLHCISALASFFSVQYQSNYVFQPMIRLLKDPVHNVVLLAIEMLSRHKESIRPFRRQYELKPILESLTVESSPQTIRERASALLAECQ